MFGAGTCNSSSNTWRTLRFDITNSLMIQTPFTWTLSPVCCPIPFFLLLSWLVTTRISQHSALVWTWKQFALTTSHQRTALNTSQQTRAISPRMKTNTCPGSENTHYDRMISGPYLYGLPMEVEYDFTGFPCMSVAISLPSHVEEYRMQDLKEVTVLQLPVTGPQQLADVPLL